MKIQRDNPQFNVEKLIIHTKLYICLNRVQIFFTNQIISRINHEFFLRETSTIYTICFLIPGLTKLLESNFQAVKDSMLVDLVKRAKFEDVSNFLLQVAEEFVPFFPFSSFCLLTLACIVVYFKDTYPRVF